MSELPDEELSSDKSELAFISEFWNRLSVEDFDDGAKRERLEELQREVADCCYAKPPDIPRARRLTAFAIFLIRQ